VNASNWKAWLVPGGLLLALAAALVNSSLFVQVAASLPFYYIGVFATGLLLAWRFNSGRVLFSLLTLLLAHRAVDFFSASQPHATLARQLPSGSGHNAVVLAALLIPLNFMVFATTRERGIVIAGIAPRLGLLFFESVIVAVLCRPENSPAAAHPDGAIPLWILLGFVIAIAVFVRRFFQTRKPTEPGFVWSVVAVFLWLQFAPVGRASDAYVATAALILAASLIETSYILAYHDELTGIRGRRAFNESLHSLDHQYAIAIVDIDHFKKFNDTYGHDVGDQVLCMVAARLSEVRGDGRAFRCGGEEFAIVFHATSAKEAFDHLESLRQSIEKSTFQLRGTERRAERLAERVAESKNNLRKTPRVDPLNPVQSVLWNDLRTNKSDRRKPAKKRATEAIRVPSPSNSSPDRLSVTVSIGVAESSTRYREPERVIRAADQALYRAKRKGRNRVELDSAAPLSLVPRKRARASRL